MARKILSLLLGVVAGVLLGCLGVATYGGPVDHPVIGLILATLLLASVSVLVRDTFGSPAWLGLLLGVFVATTSLLLYQVTGDGVVLVERWASYIWLGLAPLSAMFAGFLRPAQRKCGQGDSRVQK